MNALSPKGLSRLVLHLALCVPVAHAAAAQLDRIRLGAGTTTTAVAERLGLFREYGIEIEKVPSAASEAMRAYLADGTVDIVDDGLDNAVAMTLQGADVVIVTGSSLIDQELIAQADNRSIADLRGKTIIVDAVNTQNALLLKKMLLDHGLRAGTDYQLKTVNIRRLPELQAHPEYAAGMLTGTAAIQARKLGFASLGASGATVGRILGSGSYVRRQWAREHADLLERYIAANIAAQRWILDPANKTQVIDVLMATSQPAVPIDVATEAYASLLAGNGALTRDLRFDPQAFARFLALRAEVEGSWGGKAPAPAKFLDLSYYQRAQKRVHARAAETVRITPLGTHEGELCSRDRAVLFEDPTGVRILYDAGQSLTGADDPRLGAVHVVLLSHAHGDHIGEMKVAALNRGTCAQPELTPASVNSLTAEVIAAKGSAMTMARELGAFVGKRVSAITGKPLGTCVDAGGATPVPVPAACLAVSELGGTQFFRANGAARSVEVTIVQAAHASNPPRGMLSPAFAANLATDELAVNVGPATGFVIAFTNGLRVYLSGDTGLHTEMRTVVHDFHHASIAVINLGPNAITPQAAAHAMNELVQPATVIVEHANEAVTAGGKPLPGTRTAAFVNLLKNRAVYPALSGRAMEFDARGRCVAGC
jgi:ABC-type nitrate/sulfonate/bicarbonate transport system substrate-binding protein/L-ascorbate metabolism protein UlaG (beta-lactamase superfamily)